jgi:hypothetical protein
MLRPVAGGMTSQVPLWMMRPTAYSGASWGQARGPCCTACNKPRQQTRQRTQRRCRASRTHATRKCLQSGKRRFRGHLHAVLQYTVCPGQHLARWTVRGRSAWMPNPPSGPEKDGHWVCRRVVRLLMALEEYVVPPQLDGYPPVA